jgi:hypothetical protein
MSKAIENSDKIYKKVKNYKNDGESRNLGKRYSKMMEDTVQI